jgi:tRNA-2-methylthio-N6-dimethylallyladenosine synthase
MTAKLNIYIETYGCQMNEYDSELVQSILANAGHVRTVDEREADVVLLNTCAIRENAHSKIYHRLQELKRPKAMRGLTIGILGCMAQNLRDELLDSHDQVDFIAGPDSYRELPRLIAENRLTGEKAHALQLSRTETYSGVNPMRGGGVNAWIAVMRGCDNMCTFCVVPYTRGRERSRDPRGVIVEVESLAEAGYKQVTLLGQNVNSYRHGDHDFADLVRMTADVPGIERVRFTSPHPKDFPDRLLDVIAEHPHACKHIHLPMQAASNRVLDLMNRTYTFEEYLRLTEKIRTTIPGVAVSTDIIVGFPTESDSEFEETAQAMEHIGFDFAFVFKYSERKGTYAARKLKDDVAPEKKTERIVYLVELQKEITGGLNARLVGRTFEVLAEEPAQKEQGCLIGRTDTFKPTVFAAEGHKPGDLVIVRIDRSRGGTLFGHPVKGQMNGQTNGGESLAAHERNASHAQ